MKKKLLVASLLSVSLLLGGCSFNLKVGDKEFSLGEDEKVIIEEQSDVAKEESKEDNKKEKVDKEALEKAEKKKEEVKEKETSKDDIFNKIELPQETGLVDDSDFVFEYTQDDTISIKSDYDMNQLGIDVRGNIINADFGGRFLYIVGINTSSQDSTIFAEVNFINDGVVVEDSARYIDIENGCYNITSVYTDKEFTDVVINTRIDDSSIDLTGKDIDIDYNISKDGKFSGVLTNNTDTAMYYPTVAVVFWDENKNVINYGDTMTDCSTLMPNETATFEGYLDVENMNFADFNIYTYSEVYEP